MLMTQNRTLMVRKLVAEVSFSVHIYLLYVPEHFASGRSQSSLCQSYGKSSGNNFVSHKIETEQ